MFNVVSKHIDLSAPKYAHLKDALNKANSLDEAIKVLVDEGFGISWYIINEMKKESPKKAVVNSPKESDLKAL